MVDLGTHGGDNNFAIAINDRGDVVGRAQAANGSYRGFLWRQSRMTISAPSPRPMSTTTARSPPTPRTAPADTSGTTASDGRWRTRPPGPWQSTTAVRSSATPTQAPSCGRTAAPGPCPSATCPTSTGTARSRVGCSFHRTASTQPGGTAAGHRLRCRPLQPQQHVRPQRPRLGDRLAVLGGPVPARRPLPARPRAGRRHCRARMPVPTIRPRPTLSTCRHY
ncbi:hypothetical protein ACIBD9_32060 [Micromonospora sp. NPDC050784]|uniref:hypothetical protein n=1 Tax=Micromonospora sp. NPDC050784 TaxID=3364281 RepID=UPI0037A8BB47